ncbi:MAG TPA: hypothetical protein VMU16_04290 [Candidatus Binataceae bacterium]|nr:hypothetical protein [Candidatus Binataceae bacterium]
MRFSALLLACLLSGCASAWSSLADCTKTTVKASLIGAGVSAGVAVASAHVTNGNMWQAGIVAAGVGGISSGAVTFLDCETP